MKTKKIYSILAGSLLLSATSVSAQEMLNSGYFVEGYNYRHQLNPSFESAHKSYISFPFLGNLNVGLSSNVGVSNFIYKTPDGGLTTFLNSTVDANEFLDGLKNNNRLNVETNIGIFSKGFHKFGGFNTIDLSLKTNINTAMPYDLFAFMKQGMTGSHSEYHFEDFSMSSQSYLELALGHSRDINEKWRVGGKLKFLIGLAHADMKVDQMDLVLSEDKWSVQGSGEMNMAVKGLKIPSKGEVNPDCDPKKANEIELDEMDFDTPGLSGFGMAIDLGATYQFREDLQFSAALLDLGFISWSNNTKGRLNGEPWEFNGFQDIPYDSKDENGNRKPNSIEEQIDNLSDQLEDCFSFQKESENGKVTRMLGATLNLGALYTLPYYENLKFGFLSSTRIQGKYSWSEGRFSANVAPVKWFDASVNYAVSSFGSSFGWLINFHPKGFNLFVGSDHQFFKITPQFVPVNRANANLAMGINFNF